MKVRNGFVSNSSSSSFVVCFKKKPESVHELQAMLFDKDQEVYPDPYNAGGYPVSQVAATVWGDLQGQEPLNVDQLARELGDYMYGQFVAAYVKSDPMPKSPDYPDIDWNVSYEERKKNKAWQDYEAAQEQYQKDWDAWSKRIAKAFLDENEGGQFFQFEYSDNDGSYRSALEHGDLFKNLPHVRISHH